MEAIYKIAEIFGEITNTVKQKSASNTSKGEGENPNRNASKDKEKKTRRKHLQGWISTPQW